MVKKKNFSGFNVWKELHNRFAVKPFSGARISEMEPFIQPTLVQALSQIVLHCETNDLKQLIPTHRIES